MLDRFATYWSLHLPDVDGGGTVDAELSKYDIDCVIQTEDQLWLIDVKRWTKATLLGMQDKDRPLMGEALGRVETMVRKWGFSGYRIRAYVVLMPADGITDMGSSIRDLNLGLGGRVKVVHLTEMLRRLTAESSYTHTENEQKLSRQFIDLLKVKEI